MSRRDDAPLGSPGSPGGRILVVDDDPVTRRVLVSMLERAHFDVLASTDGREAWSELAEARIDLVITDREMPAMDGMELLRAVRQSPRHGGVPVIMLTGTTLESAGDEADAEGASAFLTKPVSSRELLETVERLLRDAGRAPGQHA
jgi:two-component system chemotaxis response regulator CheY